MSVVKKTTLFFINNMLRHLECSLGKDLKPNFSPIFIIGAPRTGSTLLYQVLVNRYELGYLSNLHCYFWGCPTWMERLFKPSTKYKQTQYDSVYGEIDGLYSPSECGPFWYRFFNRFTQYQSDINEKKMKNLRKVVRSLSFYANKPILFKNMPCALRLKPLHFALPESIFIIIRRDIVTNACSILDARKKLYGSYDTWWSMEPPGINTLKNLPIYEQVVEQIRQIYLAIDKDKNEIGTNKFLEIHYESLCNDVYSTLNTIEKFVTSHGLILKPSDEVPGHFRQNSNPKIPDLLVEQIKNYVYKS